MTKYILKKMNQEKHADSEDARKALEGQGFRLIEPDTSGQEDGQAAADQKVAEEEAAEKKAAAEAAKAAKAVKEKEAAKAVKEKVASEKPLAGEAKDGVHQ